MTPAPQTFRADRDIEMLRAIMARLRTPDIGCSWDLEQTFASIAPFTIEEAYEVADAVFRGDMPDLRDELGDLLLQVVFHARMAEEHGAFDFGDVVHAITAKLVRRHPHVFGDARDLTAEQVKGLWDQIKAQEKAQRSAEGRRMPGDRDSTLDGVPADLPPLARAKRLQIAAASVGFDWPTVAPVLEKVHEELLEVQEAIADPAAVQEEIGDLLFAVVNLARHAGVDPETALMAANHKFMRRFKSVEEALAADGMSPADADLATMETHWIAAKQAERMPLDRNVTRAASDDPFGVAEPDAPTDSRRDQRVRAAP